MAAAGIHGVQRGTARAMAEAVKGLGNPAQAEELRRFFKTGAGEYGEGDRFLGVKVPQVREVLARFPQVAEGEAGELLESAYHEVRFLGVLVLVREYGRAGAEGRRRVFDFYLSHAGRVNNWDLVDASAPGIVGRHLPPGGGRRVLGKLARSESMWERRIAMVSTLEHIRRGDLSNTMWLAERLLGDREDLMHKAVGWMLREAGKRDERALEAFLERHAGAMARTMLRYAIERMAAPRRRAWMKVSRRGGPGRTSG